MPALKKQPSSTGGKKPVFGFVKGSRLPTKAAQRIGERILTLAGSVEKATPQLLVEDAKNPRSPLHKIIFNVDDQAAAFEYRLDRARLVLRSLTNYYLDAKGNKIETPAWISLIDEDNRHVYRPSTFVWRDDGASSQVIERFKRELQNLVNKYENAKGLAKAIRAAKVILLTTK